MKELESLAAGWLEEAETLERYRDDRGAAICRMHASELTDAVARQESDLLTLAGASQASGYTADHLRHLIAEGTIPNGGRKGSPRILRRDLPVKPGSPGATGFDPDAVAREIVGRIEGVSEHRG